LTPNSSRLSRAGRRASARHRPGRSHLARHRRHHGSPPHPQAQMPSRPPPTPGFQRIRTNSSAAAPISSSATVNSPGSSCNCSARTLTSSSKQSRSRRCRSRPRSLPSPTAPSTISVAWKASSASRHRRRALRMNAGAYGMQIGSYVRESRSNRTAAHHPRNPSPAIKFPSNTATLRLRLMI